MKVTYTTPTGRQKNLFLDMLDHPHVLIAGTTGSGKSVVINGMLHDALYSFPTEENGGVALILIDPKRVELVQYKDLPHTMMYASEPDQITDALKFAMAVTERRYMEMQKARMRLYPGGDVYVVIDELADLMTTQKRQAEPLLRRLSQIGRAAKVHIIAATQSPLREIISTTIQCNFDCRLALRTRNARDSYNIIGKVEGFPGCHTLPRVGQGFYMTPEGNYPVIVPYYPPEEINRIINHWMDQEKGKRFSFLRKIVAAMFTL